MNKNYTIYKPNKKNNGSAVQFQLSEPNDKRPQHLSFLEISNQLPDLDSNGNARFDWQNKIIVALGETDIAEILRVIEGQTDSINDGKGLFHETPGGGNKIIKFGFNPDYKNFFLQVSAKKDNDQLQISIPITPGEAIILRELLKAAVVRLFGW